MKSYKGMRVLGLVFLAVFLAVGDGVLGVSGNFRPVLAQSTKQSQQADRQAIQALINKQFKALSEENFDVYMSTISPTTPSYSQTAKLVKQVFQIYDLSYKVDNVEFVSVSATEAKVRITQTTIKIKGPEFKNNKLVGLHRFQKINGQWKFLDTVVENITYLD